MSTSANPKSAVAALPGPRMPADHGLASLGLLMQLGGSIFLGLMAFFAAVPVFQGGGAGSWALFVIGATGAIRSAFHRSAGNALVYGSRSGPMRAVMTYIGVALVQTVILVFVMKRLLMPAASYSGGSVWPLLIVFTCGLLAWPIALAVAISRPRLRRLCAEPPPPAEDLGFEGVSVLMAIGGVVGALFSAFILYVALRKGVATSPQHLLLIGVFSMLLVRSFFHAKAGVKGATGIEPDQASESAAHYHSFAVVSSVIVGGALMTRFMMSMFQPASLLVVGVICYLLLAWPLIVRRFYNERNFAVLLAGEDAPNFRRAPDAGMTALGWLLLATGAIGLGFAIPGALLPHPLVAAGASSPSLDAPFAAFALHSPWWGVGLSALALWAGIELINMTDRYKLAATVYGALGSLVALYMYWPLLKGSSAAAVPSTDLGAYVGYFQIAMALVMPVAAILLANRDNLLPAQARARVRG